MKRSEVRTPVYMQKNEVELNDSFISGLKKQAIFDLFLQQKPGAVLVEFRMFENQSA